MSRESDYVALLERLALDPRYAGPRMVAAKCPICPPELLPYGTARGAVWMTVTFLNGAVRFACPNGCTGAAINEALEAQDAAS